MSTSYSSKPRVPVDNFGDDGFKELFKAFEDLDMDDFRLYCIDCIARSRGNRKIKASFTAQLSLSSSKDYMLHKITNFMLAGEGKKV